MCKQWDEENNVTESKNIGRKLLRFNFFMLQADVLPNMGFSATRKRLIHSYDCSKLDEVDKKENDTNETHSDEF